MFKRIFGGSSDSPLKLHFSTEDEIMEKNKEEDSTQAEEEKNEDILQKYADKVPLSKEDLENQLAEYLNEVMGEELPEEVKELYGDEKEKIFTTEKVNDEFIKKLLDTVYDDEFKNKKDKNTAEEGSMFKEVPEVSNDKMAAAGGKRRRKMKGGKPICSAAGLGLVAAVFSLAAFIAYKGGEWALAMAPLYIRQWIPEDAIGNIGAAGSDFYQFLIRQINALVFIFRAEMARNNGEIVKSIVQTLLREWRTALTGGGIVISMNILVRGLVGGVADAVSSIAFSICLRAGLTVDDGTVDPADAEAIRNAARDAALERQGRALELLEQRLSARRGNGRGRGRNQHDSEDEDEDEAPRANAPAGPRRRGGSRKMRKGKKSMRKSRGGRRNKSVSKRRR